MLDLIRSVDLAVTLTLLAVVTLATISAAMLWEAVRRWLRSRAAARMLSKMGKTGAEGAAPRNVGRESLLESPQLPGPAWLEPILLYLPHRDDIQRLLDQAGLRWSVATVLLASTGLGIGLGLVVSGFSRGLVLPLLFTGAGAYLPMAYLKVKRAQRFRAFEEHFSEAIDLLARAARAGHSLATGLQVVADEAEEPVASEFRQVYEEQRFGLPMQESLLGLADRMDLVDVRIFVTAVLIQRESGGNLAENLDNLSGVIRGRFRFKRDVKTKTAHGRMTGFVVALAPLVAGFMMYSMNPDYMSPLFTEPAGRMMLLTGGVMMVVGFLIIQRLVDIKF